MLKAIPWGPLTQGKLRVYCSSTTEGTIFDYFMKATRENRATCRQSQWEGEKIWEEGASSNVVGIIYPLEIEIGC